MTLVLFSAVTLFWQLLFLSACCLAAGLSWRFLLPSDFSVLHKFLFALLGGFFLVVLVAQNLVYLDVPVRISAWLVSGAALLQIWFARHKIGPWTRASWSNPDLRTLAVVILLTVTFHGIVPIRQGLEWYYGKGHFDQINYVLLAEFLKEEPYRTKEQDIGLRPWLVLPVGFKDDQQAVGMSPGPGQEKTGLKKERIGQSVLMAEISVWSGTDAKSAYAATVIFVITLLAISVYALLRETGLSRFMAASGALMAALLPAVTRLSLNGFLSQVSILFVFPFFAILLRHPEFRVRTFTLFFSLTLAYLVSAYSEIALIGFCTLFLGVLFVRKDRFSLKRLIAMSSILLVALLNPFYLRNLIEFLAQQFYYAANVASLKGLAPDILSLPGWSELLFGAVAGTRLKLLLGSCAILLGLLFLSGVIFLPKRDRLIYGTILLPVILVIIYLAALTQYSYYPIAKIILTILPFGIGLVFVALFRIAAKHQRRLIVVNLISVLMVAAAAAGSLRYYSEVLHNGDALRYVREPRFLNVCRDLDQIKNKRVLVFETHPLLTPWLCYHARRNDVFFDGRLLSDSPVPLVAFFSKIPDLANIDYVATRDRLIDLNSSHVSCVSFIDDVRGEDLQDGQVRYWLGPPAGLRSLTLRPLSANLKMNLAPGPEATTLPIDYFLANGQGPVSRGEIQGRSVEIRRVNIPRGLSTLQLSVKAKGSDPNAAPTFPILAELDSIEFSDIVPAH